MTVLPLLLLLAAGARPGPAHPAAAGLPPPTVHRWPDGLELVVQPMPGADAASLRMVLRTGGADDPAGKAGLAHLLEHLLFQRGGGVVGRELFRDARAAGAVLNAHTAGEWTRFELDAPADRFEALAERFLKLVTSPDWTRTEVEPELGVIATEAAIREQDSAVAAVDMALFPSPVQGDPIIGTSGSRLDLSLEDAVRAFRERHVPPLTTLVLAGAVEPAQAIALVERAYLVPPVPAPRPPAPDRPNLPTEQRVPAFFTATASGFVLDPADRPVCSALAALLEPRLVAAVQESGPRVSEVAASCLRMRGHDVLLALAFTSTLDAPELPADLDAVYRGLRRAPPGAEERARADRRLAHQRRRLQADAALLADRLAIHAVEHGGLRELDQLLPAPLPSPRRLEEALARSLVPGRRVVVSFALRD